MGAETAESARCPAVSWDELAAHDTHAVPRFLTESDAPYLGSDPIPVERYTSAAFFQAENEKMWPRVWQFVAREEEMPEPGDTVVYENAGRSFLLARQQDGSVRAFHNVCLHRGRKLRTESGRASAFRCPYHAFTWKLDGSLSHIPCRWDFPHLSDEKMRLPEAKVGQWAGYIFIRESEDGPSLEDFLAPMPAHFARWKHEECYTAAWVGKIVAANWKATVEAFIEAFHVMATHSQNLGFSGDANSKYMTWGENISCAITAFGTPSPHHGKISTEQDVMDAFLRVKGGAGGDKRVAAGVGTSSVPEGSTARRVMGEVNRARFGEMTGRDLSGISDAEVMDAISYHAFPNFGPWAGFMPNIVYRWRPWPDQDHTLMEVRLLQRAKPGEMKTCAPFRLLDANQPMAESELGQLGFVLDQDWANLPSVQAGMKLSKAGVVQLGNYQEVRVRQLHQALNRYLSA